MIQYQNNDLKKNNHLDAVFSFKAISEDFLSLNCKLVGIVTGEFIAQRWHLRSAINMTKTQLVCNVIQAWH